MAGFEAKIRDIAAQYVDELQRRLWGMPLQELLGAIERIDRAFAGAIERVAPTPGAPKKATKPKSTMTAKAQARRPTKKAAAAGRGAGAARKPNPFRRIQGLYVGFIRSFSGRERAQIKALAKKKGQAAAVAEMRKRLGKGAPPKAGAMMAKGAAKAVRDAAITAHAAPAKAKPKKKAMPASY
ncbi:MAG: hypothetical protein QME96_14620, partial [Myxococcota bacterium]|nr:hypothetical protein [Myxococcota bacterium]